MISDVNEPCPSCNRSPVWKNHCGFWGEKHCACGWTDLPEAIRRSRRELLDRLLQVPEQDREEPDSSGLSAADYIKALQDPYIEQRIIERELGL